MAVEDRVAFALMFLSDSKLNDYLKRLTQKLIEEGNLAGFLLTGIMIYLMLYECASLSYFVIFQVQVWKAYSY